MRGFHFHYSGSTQSSFSIHTILILLLYLIRAVYHAQRLSFGHLISTLLRLFVLVSDYLFIPQTLQEMRDAMCTEPESLFLDTDAEQDHLSNDADDDDDGIKGSAETSPPSSAPVTLPELSPETLDLAFQLSRYLAEPGPFAHYHRVQAQATRIQFITQFYDAPAVVTDYSTYPASWLVDGSQVSEACIKLAMETALLNGRF